MASLICIDPARIEEFWPLVEPLLRPAVENVGLNHFDDIKESILIGCSLVWIAWDGEIKAAASTTLQNIDGLICVLTACGGKGMNDWVPLIGKIEDYAKAEGCKALRIFGRAGWLRVLDGYHQTAVVIEKDLG